MTGRFAGLSAVVTGASSGIGAAIAAALLGEGATVHGLARTPAGAPGLSWHAVDLADDAAIAGFAAPFAAGRLDVLVHAAGLLTSGPVATTPIAELDRQHQVNLRAPYLLTQGLQPALVRAGGQVVFLNSSVWGAARGGLSGYAASKYALKAFADALRAEVNPAGLRVLSVFPGRTASRMQAEVHAAEGKPYRPERLMQPGDVAASVLDALALPRTAELTDLHIRPALTS
jgi:NAD(P)-dependent dehydrogenase (short-subunit alcohol dehydrogenase family)